MPYHPMKKHMEKLDEWGSSTTKKFNATRDAGPGVSLSDRLNLARGKDDRWERTKQVTRTEEEDETNIVPQRNARSAQLPPAPPSLATNKVRPPPPPSRTASGGGSSVGAPPPAPARGKAPAPPLPRRMDNEAGTDRPPPPYGSASSVSVAAPTSRSTEKPNHMEFSKFSEQDKQDFFTLLDEFFSSRSNGLSPSAGNSIPPSGSALHRADERLPIQATNAIEVPTSQTSKPGPKASVFPMKSDPKAKSKAVSSPSSAYPLLSASALPASDLCTALTCSTFLCYRDSYPEWSGAKPWFTQPNSVPSSLVGRTDVMRTSSWMYSGNDYTLFGAALFADLSFLWWKVSWDSTDPAGTARNKVAYREPPKLWDDDERLREASKNYGDWVAGFAETSERNRTPVGDGECWTLAAEAIKYTNQTAQLTEANRLMNTVGRTHGYLLYAGKADEVSGQRGRWRGGDRGRVRRGDIVEWLSAKCGMKGVRGAYTTLGSPWHTAVIVEDSPAPGRDLSLSCASSGDYYSILGVAKSATAGEIRTAYLQSARQYHPDKNVNGSGDDRIQRLNEAHATLSDTGLRAKYDEQLRGRGGSSNLSRVTAEVDLDSMQVVEDYEPMTFYHACRCGSGFYINEGQMQDGQDVVACSGCSEQIRVKWQDEQGSADTTIHTSAADEDEQPSLAPWELGYITTIEQSAGQVPTRRTYDLSQSSFTKGDIWIYRPVWESEYLCGPLDPSWPPSLPGWEALS